MNSKLLLGEKTIRPAANTLYLGSTGCGKSNFMKENIIAQAMMCMDNESKSVQAAYKKRLAKKFHETPPNLVVLDLGDNIYNDTKKMLSKVGYRIQYCDVMENVYNPFMYMKSNETILDFADIVAKATIHVACNRKFVERDYLRRKIAQKSDREEKKKLAFWYHWVKTMLTEYLMRYKENEDLSELSMKALYDICHSGAIREYADETIVLNEDDAKEIIDSLYEALELYRTLDGANKDMIDLATLFTEEKQVIFFEMNYSKGIPTLMYQVLLGQLFHHITSRTKPLSQELLFFLDELPGINRGSWTLSVGNKLSAMEANGAAIIVGAQSITQLSGMYPYFTRILYTGTTNDNRTARYLKACAAQSKKSLFRHVYRNLLDEYRLMRLSNDDIYIIENGKPIIKDKKLTYKG